MNKRRHTEAKKILAVVTSTPAYEKTGYRTGLWLGELTHFYDVVTKAGYEVVIASPRGGMVPIDPESLAAPILKLGATDKRYEDPEFMSLLADTPSLREIAGQEFEAIYLAGGHGTMFDFPYSEDLVAIIERLDQQGKIVSAVCHGPAGFLSVRGSDGNHFLNGRKVTGFSWPEEKLAGRAKAVTFRLDEALEERGAKYSKALRPMAEKVVVDGNLVTGQNPMSAKAVGEAVVKLLRKV